MEKLHKFSDLFPGWPIETLHLCAMTQADPSFGYLMKVYINRMWVITSAYQLIRPQGGKLVVKWTSNGELNCPAKALFSLPRGIRVMDVTDGDNSTPPPQTSLRRGVQTVEKPCHCEAVRTLPWQSP